MLPRKEMDFSAAFSVVSHDPRFWTRGSHQWLDTQEFVVSSSVAHTHTHVFRAFSHRGTGEEPGQSAFVLSSVYLVSVMSVKIYMIKKLGERGKKLISIES